MRTNLILLLLVASTTLSAQFTRHFSLLVGTGWSGFFEKPLLSSSGTYQELRQYRTSLMSGVGFNFDFIKVSSFETNLMLQQTGSNYVALFDGREILRNRVTAISLQLSLAYRYSWIKRQNFGLHSKFGFLLVKPIHLVSETIRNGSSRVARELSLAEALPKSFYFPYYAGVSATYKDFELALCYAHSPAAEITTPSNTTVRSSSIFSNLQFELRYRIY